MPILTATELTIYSSISATVGTIVTKKLVEEIQDIVVMKTNNYFCLDLDLQDTMTFYASNNTIVANNSFADQNFVAGDDVFIYGSYRNDGYHIVSAVDTTTLTITSASSMVDELSGRSILISVVKWPLGIKKIAARMAAYDYDDRPNTKGIKSRTLGPFTESYSGESFDSDGYPISIVSGLDDYSIIRFM